MEKAGQDATLGSKCGESGFHEEIKRCHQGRHREDGWIAQLPSFGGRHRNESVFEMHAKAGVRVVAPPAGESRDVAVGRVSLVNEGTPDGAWAAIEILVGAPRREVDVPVVEGEWDISRGVSEIEAGKRSGRVSRIGNCREIEQLTGSKVDAAEHHGGEAVAESFDFLQNVFGSKKILARSRRDSDDVGGGVAAPRRDVRLDGVGVAGKGAVFHQENASISSGAVEGHQEQMQVDGQRVHRDDLGWERADDLGEAVSKILVIRIPGTRGIEVALDTEPRPVVEFLFDDRSRRDRLQSEGVPDEI